MRTFTPATSGITRGYSISHIDSPYFFIMQNKSKIHRSKIIGNFTKVANDLIRDKSLTMQEKCILIFILSHPEDWSINKQYLYNSLPDSKGSIDTAFKNLSDKGYIHSHKIINEFGRFTGWYHEIYETPNLQKPNIGKPTVGNSEVGQTESRETEARKSPLIQIPISTKTDYTNNELDTKNELPKANANFTLEKVKYLFNNQNEIAMAEVFFYHYESLNWMVGGTEIKNLEPLVTKWILNQKQKSNGNQRPLTDNRQRINNLTNSGNDYLRAIGELDNLQGG